MINLQTFGNGFWFIVITEYKIFATGIANIFYLRCSIYNMISCSTFQPEINCVFTACSYSLLWR